MSAKTPKKVPREFRLQVRLTTAELEEMKRAARKEDRETSAWLRSVGLREARKSR